MDHLGLDVGDSSDPQKQRRSGRERSDLPVKSRHRAGDSIEKKAKQALHNERKEAKRADHRSWEEKARDRIRVDEERHGAQGAPVAEGYSA
jgi:hypothetical protein